MFLLFIRKLWRPAYWLARLAYRNVNLQTLILAPLVLVLSVAPYSFKAPSQGKPQVLRSQPLNNRVSTGAYPSNGIESASTPDLSSNSTEYQLRLPSTYDLPPGSVIVPVTQLPSATTK